MSLIYTGFVPCSSDECGGMPCTQCKVLYVGKYSNPSFGPLGEHLTWHVRGASAARRFGLPPKHPQFLPLGPIVQGFWA